MLLSFSQAHPEISTFTAKLVDDVLNCSHSLNFSSSHTASPGIGSLLWPVFFEVLYIWISRFTAPPQHVHFQLPISIYNLFLSTFSTKHNKTEGGEPRRSQGRTQPGTLSMNFSSSPSPSVIDKQSFPYAVDGVMALTEAGMLWGENIVQQWHRSNLGLTEWFHRGLLLPQSVWPRGPCQPCC